MTTETPILDTLIKFRATRLGSDPVIARQLDVLIAATRDGGVTGFRAARRANPPRGAVHGGLVLWDAIRDMSAASLTAEEVAADGRPGLSVGSIQTAVNVARTLWALRQERAPVRGAPRGQDWRVPSDWEFSDDAEAEIAAHASTLVGARG